MPSPALDHTHPEILPLDDFPAIFSSLISLLCLRSHLSSLKCRIFYCWGFAVSMTFHFASNSHVNSSTITRLSQHLCVGASRCGVQYSSSPHLFRSRDQFHGRQLFHRCGGGRGGLGIIQARYTYCVHYFYYYYINSTSGHQVSDPRG